jgi:ribonuclease D
LQSLLETRDELARAWSRPPFMVLPNQVLIDWAQAPPAGRRALVSSPGGGRALLERVADRVLEALERAEALPEQECPRSEPARRVVLSASEERRLARLRAVREEASRRLGLAPGLLVNGATLEKLAREGGAEAGLLKRWQAEALGAPFLRALD